jgi:hypothetical protein
MTTRADALVTYEESGEITMFIFSLRNVIIGMVATVIMDALSALCFKLRLIAPPRFARFASGNGASDKRRPVDGFQLDGRGV